MAFLFFSTSTAQTLTPHYRFERLTVDDGLSQNSVNAIIQDRHGFMWFGTDDGLNRYDGYDIVVYQHDPSDLASLPPGPIHALYEDRSGTLWIGMRYGLVAFDRSTGAFRSFRHDPDDAATLSHNAVTAILPNAQGRFWVGTEQGANLFDPATGAVLQKLYHNPDEPQATGVNAVFDIMQDHAGDLWIVYKNPADDAHMHLDRYTISSDSIWVAHYQMPRIAGVFEDHTHTLWLGMGESQGLYQFDRDTERPVLIKKQFIAHTFAEMPEGILWIGGRYGFMRLDLRTLEKQFFWNDPADPHSLSGISISVLYVDRSGNLWIGTEGRGVNRLDTSPGFTTYTLYPDHTALGNITGVRAILADADSTLWVGGDKGLLKIDRTTGESIVYQSAGGPGTYALLEDRNGILWIGRGRGLVRFDRQTGRLSAPFITQTVFELLEDRAGRFWAGTKDGLMRFDQTTQEVIPYPMDPGAPDNPRLPPVFALLEDHAGQLWVGTDNGLYRFIETPDGARPYRFQPYRHDPADSATLSSNAIKCLYESPDSVLWIGTDGSGLNRFDPDTGHVRRYTTRDGLPNNVVYGILPDDEGGLWMSTNLGLSRFDTAQETFLNYTATDGLPGNEFNTASFYRSPDGELFFGGVTGFTSFRPEQLQPSEYSAPLVITSVTDAYRQSLIDGYPADLSEMTLSYQQNVVSFSFAALDYTNPQKNRYAYRMEGFDADWIETDASQRFATYTNLDAGDYIFRVRGTNSDGVWNENGPAVRVTIMPAPWATWWAYTLYALVIFGVIYWRFDEIRRHNKELVRTVAERTADLRARNIQIEEQARQLENQNMQLEQQAQQLKEQDMARSRFFANISHEFRTPLTLIRGPVEDVSDEQFGPISQRARAQLDIVQRNTERLQQLIDQLLALSQLEAGKLVLHASEADLITFLRRILDSFSSLSRNLRISLSLETDRTSLPLYFDAGKLEQVINNLLSNALKFTEAGGQVMVRVQDAPEAEAVNIQVSDTGSGIPAEALPRIFERFYQVDTSTTRSHEGAGIGLALCRELTELHHGEITVESALGAGTTFTVALLKGRAHLSDDEVVESKDEGGRMKDEEDKAQPEGMPVTEPDMIPDAPEPPQPHTALRASHSALILIAEDNPDMRAYIRQHLEDDYRIQEAADGREALALAKKHAPDLIISDVMMPRMDGMALSHALKEDEALRTIPVILLTARAGEADRLDGLAEEVDDYLTKPFRADELKLRVRNLLAMRQRMREQYRRQVVEVTLEEANLPTADRAFLEQAREVIEQHMADAGFNARRLAEGVYLSERTLRRRIKELTGLSPVEFIRGQRLQRAHQLLKAGAYATVAEVAHAVGFTKTDYFSSLYRGTYGQSPSDVLRRQDEG